MLPFVQVETDFIAGKAPRIAALAGISTAQALGHSVMLFAFIVSETSTEETPPTGILLDPDAATIFEAVVGWTGDPGRLFSAWVRAELVEKLEIGARVRGPARYAEAWRTAKSRSDKAKAAAAARWAGNAQTMPEHQPSIPQADAPRCQDGDGDGDGDQLLPSEVEKREGSASPPLALVAPAPEPVEALQAAWNSLTAPPLPRWQETSDKRRKAAKARLRERPMSEWREVIQRIAASDFCRGGNDRGWAAGPDFLLRPDTAAKVLEGTYDNRQRAGPARDIRRGVARAEDQDHSKARVTADGTIDF